MYTKAVDTVPNTSINVEVVVKFFKLAKPKQNYFFSPSNWLIPLPFPPSITLIQLFRPNTKGLHTLHLIPSVNSDGFTFTKCPSNDHSSPPTPLLPGLNHKCVSLYSSNSLQLVVLLLVWPLLWIECLCPSKINMLMVFGTWWYLEVEPLGGD